MVLSLSLSLPLSLSRSLSLSLSSAFPVSLTPVQDYPKLSQAYYGLLEVLAQDHMDFVSTLEPEVFIYILSSISEGLTGLGLLEFYC